jgi:hypothetical protein
MKMKQREIKFRGWNRIVNRMQEFTLEDIEKLAGKIQWQNLEIMQSTGLKDKNGKEIYEGDIITTNTGKNIKRDGWMFQHWFGEAMEGDQCEVIGDIYRNPELINKP